MTSPRASLAGPLVFMALGVAAFATNFAVEGGLSVFSYIREIIADPSSIEVESAIALSAFLTVALVVILSPSLIRWLPSNRLILNFLGVMAACCTAIMSYFALTAGLDAPFLIFLALSPAFTLIGLLLIKPITAPEVSS